MAPPPIFVDTSAFKALFDFGDEFHNKAATTLDRLEEGKAHFVTSNFILDETYTLLRAYLGKTAAIQFRKDLISALGIVDIVRVTINDERKAWEYFVKLPGRGVSYTDCTSFALMKRLGIKRAFAFDRDFVRAGFKVLP